MVGDAFSVTSGDITTSQVTSGALSTGAVTSGLITTSHITSGHVITTGVAPENSQSETTGNKTGKDNTNAIIGGKYVVSWLDLPGLVGSLFVVFIILGIAVAIFFVRKRKSHNDHHEMEESITK